MQTPNIFTALILAAAATTAAVATPQMINTAEAGSTALQCEIRIARSGSLLTLEPVVHNAKSASGSYQFVVSGSGGSGSSNIRQGGSFETSSSGAESLGLVTLSGSGSYDARLTVRVQGHVLECRERIRGL
ncbi:MAG: curli-like amyloid fiber formation chaperone CsgH [Hyphomicrobiaceae bacterium]